MKIAIDVKTNKKAIRPSPDNIIIYDGKDWYVTTKKDLFAEYDKKFEDKLEECDVKIKEMKDYQISISKQMLEYNELIKEIITKENE